MKNLPEQEYIITNGLGGYSSSTICGANTRRYHGMLVAALNPPTARMVLLSKIDEVVKSADGEKHFLSTNYYPNAIYPQGYRYINNFSTNQMVCCSFADEDFAVDKTIYLKRFVNTVFIEYKNLGKSKITLYLTPLFVYRDYHSLFRQNDFYNFFRVENDKHSHIIYPHYQSHPIYQAISHGEFIEERYWVKNVEYLEEMKRGLDFYEDYYSLGKWKIALAPNEKVVLAFSSQEQLIGGSELESTQAQPSKKAIISQQQEFDKLPYSQFVNDLIIAAKQFIVKRNSTDNYTIIAGYHWFTDWGRDTMIALRGLGIALGKQQLTISILDSFFKFLDKGMLPNRFPDNPDDEVEYNTVDATLWLFIVLYEYHQKFDDIKLIKLHFFKLGEIIEYYINGTRYNIHATKQGFIYAGEGITQLTWMDARIGDYVVTPRHGCAVEINALWFNALKIYSYFAKELKLEVAPKITTIINNFPKNFRKYFYYENGLYDVVIPDKMADDSCRPNQIYALSLPFAILDKAENETIIKVVEDKLYTRFGLRTLNRENLEFKGIYQGDGFSRDSAYHQGTIWPFLWSEFWSAKALIVNDKNQIREQIKIEIKSLQQHFYHHNGLNTISEIFNGEEPNEKEGKGTISQAWSVGNLIKLIFDFNLEKSL